MFDAPDFSLLALFGFLAVIGLIFALRAFLGYRSVALDAQQDYDYKSARQMIPKGMTRERYIEIYRRVNNPRGLAYIASGLGLILILTPPLFLALEWGMNLIYEMSGQNRVIEPGYLVWQFILYFTVLMVWALIAYLIARHYHRRTPGSLQFEIDQDLYGEKDLSNYDYGNPFNMHPAILVLGFFGTIMVLVLSRIDWGG